MIENIEDPDKIVSFRVPKNETTPQYRHLALNAEGIQYLNEISNIVHDQLNEQEQLKLLIVIHLCESEAILDKLIESSSSSSSSTSFSSSDLSMSEDNSSSSDESFVDMMRNDVFVLEDAIMHLCITYNISCTKVDNVISVLFDYTLLTRAEVNSVDSEFKEKRNERFDDLSDQALYKWTRFTSSSLYKLKRYFLPKQTVN